MLKVLVAAFLALSVFTVPATAQNPQGMFNLFNGFMQSAIIQESAKEWRRIPAEELVCIDRMLRSRGENVQFFIQRGIGPANAPIAEDRAECRHQSTVTENTIYFVANTRPPDAFLALRTQPNSGVRIMAMPNGTKLQVLQRRGDGWWYVRVVASGQEGWALSGENSSTWIECCTTDSANQPGNTSYPSTMPQTANQPELSSGLDRNNLSSGAAVNPHFVVDGLALDTTIHFDAAAYRSFSCKPSEQFQGFTICHRRRLLRANLHSVESILHSTSGTAVYISQVIWPATFNAGDVDREIRRLSERFGLRPQILRSPDRPGFPHGVIAYWGDTSLVQLGDADIDRIRKKLQVQRGFLFDFYDNYADSTKANSPIYQLTGGAGYIWGATYDDSGRGRLRMVTIDPSAFMPTAPAAQSASLNDTSPSTNQPAAQQNQVQAEEEKKERTEKLTTVAKGIVEDASAFVKSAPQNSKLLLYVQDIAELNNAISGGDLNGIERLSKKLTDELSMEPAYQALEHQRVEAQKRDEAQHLSEEIKLAKEQGRFINNFVRDNPTSPHVLKLLPMINQLSQVAAGKTDLSTARSVTGGAELAIREANLNDKFIAFETAPPPDKAAQNNDEHALGAATAQSGLPVTERNRFLIEGNLGDVVLLYNSSSSAPHIALNLRNQYVFTDGRANACVIGRMSDVLRLAVKARILSLQPQRLLGLHQTCDLSHLNNYDIVIALRGEFLKQTQADALALVAAIEKQQYRKLSIITSKEIDDQAEEEQKNIRSIESDVAKGTRKGFGIVLLKTGSPVVCFATTSDDDVHSHLLLKVEDRLAADLNADPSLSQMSLKNAFINAQKGKCGAIYADAEDLKQLTADLSHLNIAYSFSSIWMTPQQVVAAKSALQNKRRLANEAAARHAQQLADEEKLKAVKLADQSAKAAAQQAADRVKYGSAATALGAALAQEIKSWTKTQQGNVPAEFPAYGNWLSDQFADHWELEDINSNLADYGTANFKGRELESVVSRIKVRLKNRLLGEYEKRCYLFGRINDAEFRVTRDPFVVVCDDVSGLEAWKEGHQFQSRWIVDQVAGGNN